MLRTEGMECQRIGAAAPCGTLFFIHGLGASARCFEPLARDARLDPWARVLPDLPGYGHSWWPAPPMSLDDLCHLVVRAAGAIANRPLVLVGHSMGGTIAQLAAELAPERVDAVVNIEGNLCLDDCTLSALAAQCSLETFVAKRWSQLRKLVIAQKEEHPALRCYDESLEQCDPAAFHGHGIRLVELSTCEDLVVRMKALPLPKLFIAGMRGGMSPRAIELLGGSGLDWVGIPDAGHWPFVEQSDEFIQVLLGFLTRIRGTQS